MRARIWVKQGQPDLALVWAAQRGIAVTDEPDYLREYEHVTLARALLGAGDRTAAGFLERLLASAEAGGRHGSVPGDPCPPRRRATAHGDIGAAMAALSRALELGEPEGYARTFTAEGPPMASLLTGAAKRGVAPSYVTRLLDSAHPAPRESARHGCPGRPAQRPRARGASTAGHAS